MAELPINLLPDDTSKMDEQGDNAWQLTAATLVRLQSVPGLVILYVSIVKKQRVVNSAFMALNAFASVLVCWGYQISFGDKMTRFLGRPDISLDQKFLLGQAFLGYLPNAPMVYFQIVMNFHAWMLFVPLWLTFSYTITAYCVWCPDGWLAKLGIIDYSGGYVIHLSSGVAGFTAAYWSLCGTGGAKDRERSPPNYIVLMLAGSGLLWMGWSDASLAVLNTHVCTATSLLTWLLLGILFFGKPSVIGATQSLITGLVCVTPAAVSIGKKLDSLNIRQGVEFTCFTKYHHTSIICLLIRSAVPLRLSDEELQTGDDAIHGEEAYALWGHGEKYESIHGIMQFMVLKISLKMCRKVVKLRWLDLAVLICRALEVFPLFFLHAAVFLQFFFRSYGRIGAGGNLQLYGP
ncbi:ammonium transporter member [Salix suchowensis]|nr:ammonium transporter member [Salix suchowensis]